MRVVALLALAAAARSAVNTPGLARHVRTTCVTMAARGEPGYKRHRLRKALGGLFGRTRQQDALAASSSDASPEVAVTALDTARIVAAAADAPTLGRWSAEDTERLSSVELGKVLAKKVRAQLQLSRTDPSAFAHDRLKAEGRFNASTAALPARYLQQS